MRIVWISAGLLVGYLIGAFGGGYLVDLMSSNRHDRAMEAAMTGAFVTGPIGAVIGGLLAAFVRPGRSS